MKPLLIIAGAGQTGRELALRLVPNWRVVVIDKDPAKLERLLQEGAPPEVGRVEGDATSSLVLRQAGIESAHSAVAVTGRDESNLEFCRLAREAFQVPRVMAMAVLRGEVPRFEELGVEVLSRPYSVASTLQSRLERGKRTTADVGLGKGEIYEVKVLPHSPVIGKTLADLHPQSWLVGAIYRKARLVVPHGDTVIEQGDRVLLVGDPALLPAIADYFRSGKSEFPLQYGTRVLLANPTGGPEGRSVDEAFCLVRETKAFGVKILPSPGQDPATLQELSQVADLECTILDPGEEQPWGELLRAHDCGCLVIPAPKIGVLDRMGLGNRVLMDVLNQARQPCLVSRGTWPYRRILVAVAPGPGPTRAVELATDVARVFGATLTACSALPPSFVTGEERNRELQEALRQSATIGALYSLKVNPLLLEGNPVHQVLEQAAEFDLLVMGHRKRRAFSLTRPDVSRHLLLRAPCSVMVLPYGREDLGGG